MRLVVAVAAATLAALAAGAGDAQACSCALGDPRVALARADGAFVGRLVEKRDGDGGDSAALATYVFRVDEVVKGRLGGTVLVRSSTSGASCGLETRVGEPIGLLLQRVGGEWQSSLCLQLGPAQLRAAARPLPAPDGRGPVALLVAGRWGGARTMALDARGRTLAYGRGRGDVVQIAACPGSRRSVEVVAGARDTRLVVRVLASQRRLREARLPVRARVETVPAIRCRDALARSVDLVVGRGDGFDRGARVLRVGPGGARTLWRGRGFAAALTSTRAFVGTASRPFRLVAVDLARGRTTLLARLPLAPVAVAPRPDGRAVAVLLYGAPLAATPPPSAVGVVDLRRRSLRTARLGGSNVGGSLAWRPRGRLVVLPDGEGDVGRVLDPRLRRVGRLGPWRARGGVVRGSAAWGVGFTGLLVRAQLPRGPVRAVRHLPGPTVTRLVAVAPG